MTLNLPVQSRDLMDEISEQNLSVLNVRTVVSMFSKMKECISQLSKEQKDIKGKLLSEQQKENKHQQDLKVQFEKDIENAFKIYQDEIQGLKKEVSQQKQKTQLLSNLLKFNHQISEDISRRLDAVELNNAKKSMILTGLNFSDKKKERIHQITQLFIDILQVRVPIEDALHVGGSKSKACGGCV